MVPCFLQESHDVFRRRRLERFVVQGACVPDAAACAAFAADRTLSSGHGEAVGVVRLQDALRRLERRALANAADGAGLALGGGAAAALEVGREGRGQALEKNSSKQFCALNFTTLYSVIQ